MAQIYDASPARIRELVQQYTSEGVWSRAVQCYERLLFLGNLRRNEYLRLALVLYKQGRETAAKRALKRYKAIYKSI
jgi:DNA-binding SARP family transcriptional activator